MSKENLKKWCIAGLQAFHSALEQSIESMHIAAKNSNLQDIKSESDLAALMMENHRTKITGFLEKEGVLFNAVHDEIADGIDKGAKNSEKAAIDNDIDNVAALFRGITSMNYFVAAFANHSDAAGAAGLDEQAEAFAMMSGEYIERIKLFRALGQRSIFSKFE